MQHLSADYFLTTLKQKQLSIVCAESVTAGLLVSTIASVPGASEILCGSIVTYKKEFKVGILKVDQGIIDQYTAESMETTLAMVEGLVKIYPDASIHVAVTGVASISGDRYKVNKEVGQIYVSIYYKGALYKFDTVIKSKERNQIREMAVQFIFSKILQLVQSS